MDKKNIELPIQYKKLLLLKNTWRIFPSFRLTCSERTSLACAQTEYIPGKMLTSSRNHMSLSL
jgi:hypothetical protein